MKRKTYLEHKDVAAFVNFMASKLDDHTLQHGYQTARREIFTFHGLADALAQYKWPFRFTAPDNDEKIGMSFADNASALDILRQELRNHLPPNNRAGSDQGFCEWACAVMKWGGVTNGNVTWLQNNMSSLAREVKNVNAIFDEEDDDLAKLEPIQRFNSGMTKVYSLLRDDFIIYDSRVAAALAWFVVKWCEETVRKEVPSLLAFGCMPAKEGENPRISKIRNPSTKKLQFPDLRNNVYLHAQWNLRASWILKACLEQAPTASFHQQPGGGLRALEAALFMWGYDLGQVLPDSDDTATQSAAEADEVPEDNLTIDGLAQYLSQKTWQPSKTLGGKAKEFSWTVDTERDALLIKRSDKRIDAFSSADLFGWLHRLYDKFGFDWIPLANNVTLLQDGKEQDGLGSLMHSIVQDVPRAQAVSQLGPVFKHFAIFEWNERTIRIAFRLRAAPPPCIDDLRMVLFAF